MVALVVIIGPVGTLVGTPVFPKPPRWVNRYRRGLDIFFSFFDAPERRVWLSAESKILASTFGRFRLYRLRTVRPPLVIIFVKCREKLVGQLLECQNNCGNDYICIGGCSREMEEKEKKCPCGQLCPGSLFWKSLQLYPPRLIEFFFFCFFNWSFQMDVHATAGADALLELKIGNSKVKASFYYYKIILMILSW